MQINGKFLLLFQRFLAVEAIHTNLGLCSRGNLVLHRPTLSINLFKESDINKSVTKAWMRGKTLAQMTEVIGIL